MGHPDVVITSYSIHYTKLYEVADKTGQINYDDNGHALTQGVSEMVISALYKTSMVRLVRNNFV